MDLQNRGRILRFFVCEILRFIESSGNRRICEVDSASLWILRWILQNYLVWLIEVGKGKRILLLAKAKSSKNFFKFHGIAESLGNYSLKGGNGAKDFTHCVRDSVSLHFACEILRNCRIAGGFKSLKEKGLYFWQKPKVAKAFFGCFALDFLTRFCGRRITIEVMAVWLCTAFCPLLGNRTCGPLTTQGGNRRVNCIPQNKLPRQKRKILNSLVECA